jgi:hypothetical protein
VRGLFDATSLLECGRKSITDHNQCIGWGDSIKPERRMKFVIASLLVLLMIVVFGSFQEGGIPTATYELIPSNPIDDDESIEISSSPQSPVTSALLLNESVLSPDSIWFEERYGWTGGIYLSRQFPIPRMNVSTITLRLSATVAKGPININLRYYFMSSAINVNGSSGETVEMVKDLLPDDLGLSELAWIAITLNSTDTSALDHLYFSISAVYTTEMLPVTMDLQRTNGESLFNLPELYTIYQTLYRPYILLDAYRFYISQVNDTLFLPAGNYSLSVIWIHYHHSFGNISLANESLYLELRIKTVRLDVESLQKIPGMAIYVETAGYHSFYYDEIMIADDPSFYLPSMSHVTITVRGGVESSYWPLHFYFYIDYYENQNITLVVNENWILIGNVAFTPGRFIMLIGLISIFILTIMISRRELLTSSIYLPFLLLFLANTLPIYSRYEIRGEGPYRIPFFIWYIKTETVSSGISTSITSVNCTATAISSAGSEIAIPVGLISSILLLFVLLTVIYEYLRNEGNPETSDFPVIASIMCSLVIQTAFFVGVFFSSHCYFMFSLGPGLAFTVLALVMWVVLFKRQGKTIFETS